MPANPDPERLGPRRSDPTVPSAARVYDFLIDGTYNYPVDQIQAARLMKIFPYVTDLARHNRTWVQRAVRYLVQHRGVRQFLDIGSGIPTAGNVHEVAQAVAPETRVVYVDIERVAVDIALEVLENNPYCTALHADMRLPETVLGSDAVRQTLDFDKPLAMVWGSVLHFIEDEDGPLDIFNQYKESLKRGDYVVLSHLSQEFLAGKRLAQVTEAVESYNANVSSKLTLRRVEQIERFFDGTELIEPGLVPLPDWRPDLPGYEPDPHDAARDVLVGGVGRLI
jgi:hypothetical protein